MRGILGAGLALALLASGCGGGPSAEELAADRIQLASAITDELKKRDRAAAAQAAGAREQACRTAIGAFITALRDVDSRLDVGVSVDEYSDIVGDASVERGRVDVAELSGACRQVVTKAENALDNYRFGADTWNDCVYDYSFYFPCEFDDIDPEMQDYWADASAAIGRAERKLKEIGTVTAAPKFYSTALPETAFAVAGSAYGAAAERLCGASPPVAAAEACQHLSDVLQNGVKDSEASELNDALVAVTDALGITPPALRSDDS